MRHNPLRTALAGKRIAWMVSLFLCGLMLQQVARVSAYVRQESTRPPSQWTLSKSALDHIKLRHFPGSKAIGAGKFIVGTDEAKLRKWIRTTFRNGRKILQERDGKPTRWKYEHTFEEKIGDIGTDGRPAELKILRLILEQNGAVVTAFPVKNLSIESDNS